MQCGRSGFHPWVGKIPWRRERVPTAVFWPGEFSSPWQSQSRLINRLSLSPEAGREAQNRFLLSPQKEPTLLILWLQMSSLKNCQKINFCCLNYVAVVLSYSSSTKLIDCRYKELKLGLPWWLGGKESTCQCRKCGVNPWSRKIPHAAQRLSLCAVTTEHVH